jgi:hypothetical protein
MSEQVGVNTLVSHYELEFVDENEIKHIVKHAPTALHPQANQAMTTNCWVDIATRRSIRFLQGDVAKLDCRLLLTTLGMSLESKRKPSVWSWEPCRVETRITTRGAVSLFVAINTVKHSRKLRRIDSDGLLVAVVIVRRSGKAARKFR